ncbi:cell division protein ZapA [Halolactibacillus alkaliphilus]|uniref:Cell division protein ZapA n=1 Tax=Halolactibacillus alkaliphilus TaxID=442899 RepID=A0A511X326_9BACI|nr:cell division protein ZapA [Halolactibacillus alkaliphilus]GEN57344.1 cell division protein ZapA [Halolactibacillus alkaliphilus]GGN73030.1 cell division protein ZapA [Halolactibacillus alkaliphilus]SFO92935.1 cell division protein ZapA [Halolactibacillus alkaliphilus]
MTQAKKTRANVDIYGKHYTLVGEEDLHHMRMVASVVDDKMREIYQANKSLDTTRLAVLTAVNTMNDYLKLKEAYDALEQKLHKKEDQD